MQFCYITRIGCVHAIDAVHTNLKSSACLHEFLKAINPIGAKITITPYDPHYLVRFIPVMSLMLYLYSLMKIYRFYINRYKHSIKKYWKHNQGANKIMIKMLLLKIVNIFLLFIFLNYRTFKNLFVPYWQLARCLVRWPSPLPLAQF